MLDAYIIDRLRKWEGERRRRGKHIGVEIPHPPPRTDGRREPRDDEECTVRIIPLTELDEEMT